MAQGVDLRPENSGPNYERGPTSYDNAPYRGGSYKPDDVRRGYDRGGYDGARYDAISQRYVVTDMANGEQDTHATQADALAALAHLPAIRVADEATLPPDARFGMRVRAAVEIGELPSAIKMLLFWKSWSRSTDWYAWNVRP